MHSIKSVPCQNAKQSGLVLVLFIQKRGKNYDTESLC
nr:MAG TPA: hypothetical protein [Caudoviricetes sp.]